MNIIRSFPSLTIFFNELRVMGFVQRQLVVNRTPVLRLWAEVVAEVLGFEHDEVLTLR
jgi:hypothetical protein